ncbi:NADH-cytochrome b5 reductase-like [Lucilia sericata]|uniref:NADH-cytochrome b5 reductase-like n=1 Tax=Lucilia sericata TaxID=13632 RepID=UPI0018A7FF1F|nr:NADH-cytochrome b5 reductase-like [Lucilia sericata]
MEDINESDCCGNGCANCVLNIKQVKSLKADKSGKQNILSSYTHFRLKNKTLHLPQVNDVWELHFKSKHSKNNKEYILDMNAGYHLMMRKPLSERENVEGGNNGNEMAIERKFLLRPYSPYWWDCLEMEFKILVNLKPQGPMSEYIQKLEINDEVEFKGPIGCFEHETDVKGEKCLLIISQGVAVAPVIAIIEEILNNEEDLFRLVHIACFQDMQHVYFRDKLYDFNKYWNYKVHIYLSRELCDNTECLINQQCLETCENFKSKLKYKENIKPLRCNEKDLEQLLDKLEYSKENLFIILAGNGKFQYYFKELLTQTSYGVAESNIYLL